MFRFCRDMKRNYGVQKNTAGTKRFYSNKTWKEEELRTSRKPISFRAPNVGSSHFLRFFVGFANLTTNGLATSLCWEPSPPRFLFLFLPGLPLPSACAAQSCFSDWTFFLAIVSSLFDFGASPSFAGLTLRNAATKNPCVFAAAPLRKHPLPLFGNFADSPRSGHSGSASASSKPM